MIFVVKVFKDGKVVDEFVGVILLVVVECWFDGLVLLEVEVLVEAGGEENLWCAIEFELGCMEVKVEFVKLLVDCGDCEEVFEVFGNVVGLFVVEGMVVWLWFEVDEMLCEVFVVLDVGDIECGLDLLIGVIVVVDVDKCEDLCKVIVGVFDEFGVEYLLVRDLCCRFVSVLY